MLDGCTDNQHYWVAYAATTDVGFTVTVRDTRADVVKEYTNPELEPAAAVIDTQAFATCP